MPQSQSLDNKATEQNANAILHAMVTARLLDELEHEYTARGEAFFHVSGAGHEGVAALEPHLRSEDYIHAHYRDKALLVARGLTPYDYFLALFDKDASSSKGRQLNAHVIVKKHKVLSIAGPVANNAPQSAGISAELKARATSGNYPISVCAVGEGTTHEGEFLEALTLSIINKLPVLFLIEDNKFAISTPTEGKTFYRVGDKDLDSFMDVPITRIDGRKPHEAYEAFAEVTADMRKNGNARIVVFSVDRLASHSNADDQKIYRSIEEIRHLEDTADPIINYIMHLHGEGVEDAKKRFQALCDEMRPALREKAQQAQREANPKAVFSAKAPLPSVVHEKAQQPYESGDATMIDAMREVLDSWLEKDERVFLYGQDIEDPKGDVFGLTKGLSNKFNGRVVNSPLSESFIIGTSIGRALAGGRPVAFLQFADFLPLAFNQIYAELGSLYWRTGGTWPVPVIVMVTCGGYRPGLGPFHASVMESIVTHVPGIDVLMPSNAADAAGLLNAAFLSERPTFFFYPKSRLNAPTKTISKRSARSYVVVPGTADRVREGNDITIVGYGNTMPLCEKAADVLAKAGKHADVIDLRSMSPLDDEMIRRSVKRTGRLLVTHEDTRSVSMSSEIIARVVEHAELQDLRAIARVTRADTYVPCNFENQLEVLPSYKRILETAVELLGGAVTWQVEEKDQGGAFADILAVGISPSDEHLTIMKWNIAEGDTIQEGDLIAEGEADKSACDIRASISGTVDKLCVAEGDMIAIGQPIVRVNVEDAERALVHTVTREEAGEATISFPALKDESDSVTNSARTKEHRVCVSHIRSVLGARVVDNAEMVSLSPEWTQEKIVASTGIESRHWVGKEQTAVSMAAEAARKALGDAGLSLQDVSGIVCATGTHAYQAPSLAAMVQYELAKDLQNPESYTGYAYDIAAACSGYVFALAEAYYRVSHNPHELVLVLSSEVLSKRVDMADYGTAPVFSDAASASIVASDSAFPHADGASVPKGVLQFSPILQTFGEPAQDLVVPECGYIRMNGVKVYKVAVAHLTSVAKQVCEQHGISFDDVDMIVPHQANVKIINGVARRLQLPLEKFYSSIEKHGNSSSNTIPICLHELENANNLAGKKVLLIAFGSGYTFGGTLLDYS